MGTMGRHHDVLTVARLSADASKNATGGLLLAAQLALLGGLAIVAAIVGANGNSAAFAETLTLGGVLVAVTTVALVTPWGRIGQRWVIIVPLADIALIARLRLDLLNEQSGLSILVLIPVLWLAYSFGFGALVCATVCGYGVAMLPFLVTGHWPASSAEWGSAAVLPAIVSVAAIGVHIVARTQRADRAFLVATNEQLRISIAAGLAGAEALRVSVDEANDATSAAVGVVDTVDAGISFYDTTGHILLTNDTAREMARWIGEPGPNPELEARLVFEEDQVTPVLPKNQVVARAARGELMTREFYWIGPKPNQRAILVSSRYVRRASGELIGTVVATHDVTTLAEAIRARDNYLTTISHELRTPLTSMIGYLELVEDSLDLQAAGIATEFGAVQRNSQRLLALVNDLVVTTQLPSPLTFSRIDVSHLAVLRLAAAGEAATRAGVRLPAATPGAPPVFASLDADRITDVIDKILSNAIKFNHPGGEVTVSVELDGDEVVLRISDTGNGIAPEDQPHIFERFFRSSTSHAQAIAGAGLGLSTARVIVQAHDGSIAVRSVPGEGTTVEVRLPLGSDRDSLVERIETKSR